MRWVTLAIVVNALLIALLGSPAVAQSNGHHRFAAVPSYYPHWVSREGTLTEEIMSNLVHGSVIAAHHNWDAAEIRKVLDYPGKNFKISWYVESNVYELEDPTPPGTPVAACIAEARRKQDELSVEFGYHRFANLVELDNAREKKSGHLTGSGNQPFDWLSDAVAVKDAGFRYLAKSPAPQHISELRRSFGDDFVPHIVFEDVTASPHDDNPGYAEDAKMLAERGELLTLVIHQEAYGGFPPTPLDKARSVIDTHFNKSNVEAYWGRALASESFVKLKNFLFGEGTATD
jgi:hypothetical protein